MKPITVLALLVIIAVPVDAHDDPKKVPEQLKGEWQFVSYTHTGQEVPLDKTKSRVEFGDAKMTLRIVYDSKEKEAVSSLTVNEKDDPKSLNVSPPDRKFVAKAIWKVEKDKLTICFAVDGEERPKDFKPSKDTSVMVLERVKK